MVPSPFAKGAVLLGKDVLDLNERLKWGGTPAGIGVLLAVVLGWPQKPPPPKPHWFGQAPRLDLSGLGYSSHLYHHVTLTEAIGRLIAAAAGFALLGGLLCILACWAYG